MGEGTKPPALLLLLGPPILLLGPLPLLPIMEGSETKSVNVNDFQKIKKQ